MEDLGKYMTENIRSTMAAAYRNVLGNPREARFVLHMQQSFRRAERKRRALLEQEELAVPPTSPTGTIRADAPCTNTATKWSNSANKAANRHSPTSRDKSLNPTRKKFFTGWIFFVSLQRKIIGNTEQQTTQRIGSL